MSNTTSNLGLYKPQMIDYPSTTIPQLASNFDMIDSSLATITNSIAYVENFPLILPEVDDTARINRALNSLTNGGTVKFAGKTYNFTTININQNISKTIVIEGAGMGSTILKPTGDGIIIQSYLVVVRNLSMIGTNAGTYVGIKGLPISPTGDAVIGRTWLQYVQVTNFYNGLDTQHFDQFWIEKCNFSSNLNHGIYVEPQSGAALLNIKDTITNNNGANGLFVYCNSIIGLIKIENHESVANIGNGVRFEGTGTNTIMSVILDNIDIESVQGTNNTALYLKYVWRFSIRGGSYQPQSGQTIFSSITLNACSYGEIINPWWRWGDLGANTVVTNPLYVTGGATQIYLQSSYYYSTPIDFTIDTATTDPATCINLDLVVSTAIQTQFIPANEFVLAQGTPAPVQAFSNRSSVWQFAKSGVTAPQAISTNLKVPIRKVKSVTIYWWNDTTGTGNVAWQIGLNQFTVGQTTPVTTYAANFTTANGQYVLQKTIINTPNWTLADLANLWIIRNYTDGNDTLAGVADLVGVVLNYQ